MNTPLKLLAVSASLGLICSGARAQAPPSFPSGVDLITLDVVVTNEQGYPVAGLARDDFELKEDGRPQEIVGFEAIAAGSLEPADSSPSESDEPVPASNESTERSLASSFAVVMDDVGMRMSEAVSAREAVTSFLARSARAGDLVTLADTSGDTWWTARMPEGRGDLSAVLRRVQGRRPDLTRSAEDMTDYEASWIAEHGMGADPCQVAAAVSRGREAGAGSLLERVVARWAAANRCPTSTAPFSRCGSSGGQQVSESCVPLVRSRATELDAARRMRTHALLDVVRRSLDGLGGTPGRKSLLLLSPGYLEDSFQPSGAVMAAAREANVAVYFVDVRGLLAAPGAVSSADPTVLSTFDKSGASEARFAGAAAMETSVLESAGSRTLADDTGGFSVRNTNDLATGFARIAAESRIYYLLGFRAPAGKPPGAWRKLSVAVRRPGLTVRARRGYTLRAADAAKGTVTSSQPGPARTEPGPARTEKLPAAVERLLDSAVDVTGIPLRAMAYVMEPRDNGARVVVAVEFDASRLAYEGDGAARAAHLELTVATTRRDTGQTALGAERVEVRAGDGRPAGWRSVARELVLPPGIAQTRVVVRDPATGALGAITQRFEVPRPDVLRLSTPVLSDQVGRGDESPGAPRAALAAHRRFRRDRPFYCDFEVFGAAHDPGDGTPHVTAEAAVITADDEVALRAEPSRITPDARGRLVRLIGFDLGRLEPGDYRLSLVVTDEAASSRTERYEPFTIAR